jgi:photosystem II stability/assembly factor-like uncharacterized protein
MKHIVLFLAAIALVVTSPLFDEQSGACHAQTTQWTSVNGPWTAKNVVSVSRGYDGQGRPITYAVSADGNYLMKATSEDLSDWARLEISSMEGELAVVACYEQDAAIVYVGIRGEKGGILKSVDGGENWEDASSGLGNTDFNRLKVSPHDRDFVMAGMKRGDGSNYVLWETTDGGGYWNRNPRFEDIHITVTDIVFHPRNPDVIYVSGNEGDSEQNGVYWSENRGADWRRIVEGMSDTEIGALEIDEVQEDQYFLYAGSTEAGHFYFAVEGEILEGILSETSHP